MAALRSLSGGGVSSALVPGAALDDLRTRMGRLRPAAVALSEARRQVGEETTRQQRSLGRDRVGVISPWALAHLAQLKEASVEREATFSAARLAEAPERPVLHRLDLDTLSEEPSDARLGRVVFGLLQRTWEATQNLTSRLTRTRPARDVDWRRIYDGAVPEALIAGASQESVWALPKIVQAAAARMAAEERLIVDRLLEEVDLASARHAGAELRAGLLAGVGMAALTIALTVICPPAGIALDVALSVSDVLVTAEEYEKLGDEATSDLDPRESLSDTDPSLVPVVLAVAGVLMTAA
jgi:hypothetical protein